MLEIEDWKSLTLDLVAMVSFQASRLPRYPHPHPKEKYLDRIEGIRLRWKPADLIQFAPIIAIIILNPAVSASQLNFPQTQDQLFICMSTRLLCDCSISYKEFE